MKKFFLLSSLLVLTLLVSAQVPFSYTEGKQVVVYSLPKTEFCIEIKIEKQTQKPGMFYRYSERYLATNKIITAEKTNYQLKSVVVKSRAIPDPKRTYSVEPTKNSVLSNISVNAKGLLCGVNVPFKSESAATHSGSIAVKTNLESQALLPLGEEYMMAGSEAKLAEGAAKQIYRIRESRLGLLTADVEKLPADGASFKSMLDGLNKMETELTELFVGKIITDIQTQTIFLVPDSTLINKVLFRLSAPRGVVAADDLSGTPYYISIMPTSVPMATTDSKTKNENVGLYTILPASTQITIGDGVNTFFSDTFFVPQFGKTIQLPEGVFKDSKVKVRIDSQTGRLLSIE